MPNWLMFFTNSHTLSKISWGRLEIWIGDGFQCEGSKGSVGGEVGDERDMVRMERKNRIENDKEKKQK